MAQSAKRTIIITGGNGLLGPATAVEIATRQPDVFLVLTARNPNDANSQRVSEKLRAIGATAFDFMKLDLSSFASVRSFAMALSDRTVRGEIPPVKALINSAAYSSYVVDKSSEEGFDPVYQINVLGLFLLSVSVLGPMQRGKIINVSSETVKMGDTTFFANERLSGRNPGSDLAVKEGLIRYGSSKLIMDIAMYELRKKLVENGMRDRNIFSLDPGGISNESRLSQDHLPGILQTMTKVVVAFRPVLRHFKKSLINDVSVPASAIATVALDDSLEDSAKEVYYILDDEVGTHRLEKALKEKGAGILEQVMKDAGVTTGDIAGIRT